MTNRSLTEKEIAIWHSTIYRHLNDRCKGLLEVCQYPTQNVFWKHRVEWLHRTVKDWMMTQEMCSLLSRYSGKSFNTNRSLCRAYLAMFKIRDQPCLSRKLFTSPSYPISGLLHTLDEPRSRQAHLIWILSTNKTKYRAIGPVRNASNSIYFRWVNERLSMAPIYSSILPSPIV
jgi:hypothetical protein